jgi:LacI family transcriptional regulator
MANIKDVARTSGFSPSTVSIVLNDAPLARYIPQRTKDLIRKAAKRLRYRPNPFAQSMHSRRSHTVGVITSDTLDPYFSHILKGIHNALFHSSFLPVLADIQNQRARFERYLEMLLDRRVEGLITIANSLLLDMDLLGVVEEQKIPSVIIGREHTFASMSSVVIDNEAGTRTAMKFLYALGNRRIAFIKGPRQVVDSGQRWRGICEFAKEVDLKLDQEIIVELEQPASSYEEAYSMTRGMLQRRRPFTALMAFDDMTAFGVIRALHQAGKRVPEDCAVMGFDDVGAAAYYNPPLTTIRQPLEKLGEIGVEILTQAIDASVAGEPFIAVHRRIEPELVVRESTPPAEVPRTKRHDVTSPAPKRG